MKRILSDFILSPGFQISTAGRLLRGLIASTNRFYQYSPAFKLDAQAVERPHYAYCLLKAANLARLLGHKKISAIEFGVAGGNGLAFMYEFSKEVTDVTGVEIECYGFDSGKGMPEPQGASDLPYWFASEQYKMDEEALRNRLPNVNLVIGEIKNSIDGFLEKYDPAPIGVMFNDTDYWSSTLDSFRLLKHASKSPKHFLPRMFMYFDDVLGTEMEMYGSFNGQLLAIDEFNRSQDKVKIHLNQNLISSVHLPYRFKIYYGHVFDHPEYSNFVGSARQEIMEKSLKLRN